MFVEEARASGQLGLVLLGHTVQVDARILAPALHPGWIHLRAAHMHAQGAPVRARRAPHEEVGLASCNHPDCLVA
eukprot:5182404-Alexandrium_andersonii.AAC.1